MARLSSSLGLWCRRALVIVLFEPDTEDDPVKHEARQRLLETMKKGLHLGGGPYLSREELYGEIGRPR